VTTWAQIFTELLYDVCLRFEPLDRRFAAGLTVGSAAGGWRRDARPALGLGAVPFDDGECAASSVPVALAGALLSSMAGASGGSMF